jgi:TRAP-type C4-dicarboxylate transport system permease small subunit
VLNAIYDKFCRIERWVAAFLLMAIATLVFLSALARTIGHPLNWAVDISVLFFAWLVFIGGDIVVRESNLISVDLFFNLFPPRIRKTLRVIFYLAMIGFLIILVRYGVPLLIDNKKRMFQAMQISYSWCTLAVPAGSLLMIISCCIRLAKALREPSAMPPATPARSGGA